MFKTLESALLWEKKKRDLLFGQAGTQSLKGKRIQKARVKNTERSVEGRASPCCILRLCRFGRFYPVKTRMC